MSRLSTVAAGVLAASLVASLLALAAVPAPVGANAGENNTTTAPNTGPHTLEELRDGGEMRPDAPDSVRRYGEHGSLWLRHVPTSMFDRIVPDSELKTYVGQGETVRRDTVYLGSMRGWSAPATNLTLVVVYWEPGEVERTTENGEVVREKAAVNQRVDRHTVELSGNGYEEAAIDLRSHYENPSHVTMWVEGRQGELQWTFKQKSSTASDSFPAGSRGNFALWGLGFLLLPAGVVGGGGTLLGKKALDKAGAGAGYPPWMYAGALFFGTFFVALFAWDWFIDVIATAPWLMGVLLGLFIAIFAVEAFGDRTRKAMFLQFDLANSKDYDDDGRGELPFEVEIRRIVDLEEGGTGVVKRGIRPFIARAFGATPRLETMREEPVRMSLESHDSEIQELFLVHPYAQEILDYEPEQWVLDIVEERSEDSALPEWVPSVDAVPLIGALTLLPVGWIVGTAAVSSGLIGMTVAAIVGLFLLSEPVAGHCRTTLAPAQFDDVVANVLQTIEGLEEEADRQWYREKYHEQLGENLSKRQNDIEEAESEVYAGVVQRRTGVDTNGTEEASADD